MEAELDMLENGRSLPASSCLRSVNPFIDEVGLVRLSGRQANCEPGESSRDDNVKSMLNCSGKVVSCIIYLLLAHKTRVFTGGTDDSQSMFICDRSTFHELPAGLTKPCDYRAVAWVLSQSLKVQLSNFDFQYNSFILIRLDMSFVLNFIVEIVWLNNGGPAQEFLALAI